MKYIRQRKTNATYDLYMWNLKKLNSQNQRLKWWLPVAWIGKW